MYFVLLISFAYAADRFNDRKKKKEATEEEKAKEKHKLQINNSKAILREIAEEKGAQYLISAITNPNSFTDTEERKNIERHYKIILDAEDL